MNQSYNLPYPPTHYTVALKHESKARYARCQKSQSRDLAPIRFLAAPQTCDGMPGLRPSSDKEDVMLHDG